jgi:hypothetical protein
VARFLAAVLDRNERPVGSNMNMYDEMKIRSMNISRRGRERMRFYRSRRYFENRRVARSSSEENILLCG